MSLTRIGIEEDNSAGPRTGAVDNLDRHLSTLSICATAATLPCTWGIAASTLVSGIYGGGSSVLIWGTLASGIANSILCSCLAEYSSAFPSAAGCTYAAGQLASPKWSAFAAYFTGSLHTWAGLFTMPALSISVINLIFTCVCVLNPNFAPARWHIFLAFQAMNLTYTILLKYWRQLLTLFMNIGGILVFVVLFVTVGVVVGLSRDHSHARNVSDIFFQFENNTGFPAPMGALLGITGPILACGPPHWLLNLADDAKTPSRSIPIGLVAQQVSNAVTLLTFYIALYFSIEDINAILTSPYPSVVGAIYEQATGHRGITVLLCILLIISLILALYGYASTVVRMLYGFAREGPFTHAAWWSKIDHRGNIPINTLYVVTVANFLCGFIYLGSPNGFLILLNSAMSLYFAGYIPMIVSSLITRRHYLYSNVRLSEAPRAPYYSLGLSAGLACDTISLLVVLVTIIAFSLPSATPVTADNFNWSPLILVVFLILTWFLWIAHGRKVFGLEVLDSELEPAETMSNYQASSLRESEIK